MKPDPNKKQFEELVLAHIDFFMGVAVKLTHDRDRAEDLVQDAVLKAFRAFSGFRPGSNFRAWVARIMTNTYFTDREREKRVEYGLEPGDMHGATQSGFEAGQASGVVRTLNEIPADSFSDEVVAALQELPEEMAVAVYLADVEELPYAEIGDILGVPPGTVKSRIARGRRHLQTRLLEFAKDYRIPGSDNL